MINRQHSILPPSSAARRVACPGSRALESKYSDNLDSEYAREGHAAHWLAAEFLKGQMSFDDIKLTSAIAPNGEFITEEMIAGAKLYAEEIKNCIESLPPGSSMFVEEKVEMPNIHPESWGTPDCWLVSGTDVYLWDYKYGYGFVEVFENWQLIAYAAGILNKIKGNGITDGALKIHMFIIQPRSFHRDGQIRTWSVLASDLQPYFNILSSKEFESMQPSAVCNPSPECSYCVGRHACSALQRSALTSTDVSVMNQPTELTNTALGSELRYLKRAYELLDARITGLEEQTIAKIKSGMRIPFYRLEQSAGRARWKQTDDEVIVFGQLCEMDLAKPPAAITPNQAEKKGMSPDLIKQMVEIQKGSMKLVEDNARKLFKGRL
jgi:uncharacterized protein DUF2800